MNKLKVGHPSDKSTDIGALVSKPHLKKVKSFIEIAEQEDAKVLYGGKEVTVEGFEDGYYLQPTVIEVHNDDCRVNQEEIFGPVVTLMPQKLSAEPLFYMFFVV